MDWLSDWFIDFMSQENNPLGLAILAASAMIEYLFPPFPGDTITLFSAVLITKYQWNVVWVFVALMVGSTIGAMGDYYLGLRIQGYRDRKEAKEGAHRSRTIDRIIKKFHQHGPTYLIVNRFLPGFRALFFVAAGMAGMKPGVVLLYGTISALLWNALLLGLGTAIGMNFDSLKELATNYGIGIWLIIIAVALAFIIRWRIRKSKEKEEKAKT